MKLQNIIEKSLNESVEVLNKFVSNKCSITNLEKSILVISDRLKKGGKIISCGNGGSLCDSMHFAEELTGRFRNNRIPLAAISLSDASHITCSGNDFGFNSIFSRPVEALGKENDVLLCISTSGNSENVVLAAQAAKKIGMAVISLTGGKVSKLSEISDICIQVPHQGYSDRIQEIHIKCIHILVEGIEKELLDVEDKSFDV